MVLSNSQVSMRSLCLNLLFTPVDYIFFDMFDEIPVMLVGVRLRAC